MDSVITAAARALASGDPLGALGRVSLRDDPSALALRGIAMARLGDFERARTLLKQAARAFGSSEPVAAARCVVAEAEIALVSRDLARNDNKLQAARNTLENRGDFANAAHARHIEANRLVLSGQLDMAEKLLSEIDAQNLPPLLQAAHELAIAGIATRRLDTITARAALAKAMQIASHMNVPMMMAEVEKAQRILDTPAARLIQNGQERPILLDEVAQLPTPETLIIDACRYIVRQDDTIIALASRPVLFSLLRMLASAWPGDVSRDDLVKTAFHAREADESHRARLRVEIGRIRAKIRKFVTIRATRDGFVLSPRNKAHIIAVLAPPVEGNHGPLLALLADGEAWSSSALALTLGCSQRTIQRALDDLASQGKVQFYGKGRARRWLTPPFPGFTTSLLLPGPLPGT
ncbi:HTH domain-containing protein [Thalassospira marina]|uniref:Helix-turn-helix domain-containing protein n=1 Tax=Thalassospira marina TaxID=2048283 RepID=A0A2N3KN94_9PROT|nr:HTH domain-containing protein [Thalassospira marina]PKR52014.1 helix-turn-helix domain-containing protein [Thalassospira marina]